MPINHFANFILGRVYKVRKVNCKVVVSGKVINFSAGIVYIYLFLYREKTIFVRGLMRFALYTNSYLSVVSKFLLRIIRERRKVYALVLRL